jgi:type IV pilus assembly protein PilC
MALAEATVHNKSISSELARVRQLLVNGMSLGESMQQVSVIPAVASRMMHIGESSGQLAQVLYTVSEHTRQTADVSIKRLEQMIAPLLLLFVGLILLWIVVSVLGPVYNLAIDTVMDVH